MIERIKSILTIKNLTSSQFANEIGVQRSGISHILSGRNKPSLDFVLKISDHFPEISETWLLKGEGEMFKSKSQPSLFEEDIVSQEVGRKEVPDNDQAEKESEPDEQYKTEVKSDAAASYKEENIVKEQMSGLIPKNKSSEISKLILVYEDGTFETFSPRK